MARHVTVWMDGVELSSIGPIIVKDVEEFSPDMEINYLNFAGISGQRIIRQRRKALRVNVTLQIRELFDLVRRAAIFEAIAKWASGSILEVSNRQNQRLQCVCTTPPNLGKIRDYTQLITLTFQANEIPYWEENSVITLAKSGASGNGIIYVPGNAQECPIDVTITPGGTLTNFTLTASGGGVTKNLELSGFSTSNVIHLVQEGGIFDLYTESSGGGGGLSLLPYRTEYSDDDLLVPAGSVELTYTASRNVNVAFSGRGRWL